MTITRQQQEVNQLKTVLAEAEIAQNIEGVKDLILNKNFQHISQEAKEMLVFQEAIIFTNYRKTCEDILAYLILDYKIKEENSINAIDKDLLDVEQAEKMFSIRRAKEKLESELNQKVPTDEGKLNNRPKV